MAFHHSPKTVTDGLVLYLDAGNFESFIGGEPTINLNRHYYNFTGSNYASNDEWSGTTLIKEWYPDLETPLGNGATLITESTSSGYQALSRMGGGGRSGEHNISAYVYPVSCSIMRMGMIADGGGFGVAFNFDTQTISYGGQISNRNAILEQVNGYPGWYRIGGNIEGRNGGWVGSLGFSTLITSASTSESAKRVYVTGLQYEYKPYTTPFVAGERTTWFDQVNNNNGSLINGTKFNSSSKDSFVFDGVNDYVQLPTSYLLSDSSDWTLEFVIKSDQTSSGVSNYFRGVESTTGTGFLKLEQNARVYGQNSSGGSFAFNYFLTPAFSVDRSIAHITFVGESGVLKIYNNSIETTGILGPTYLTGSFYFDKIGRSQNSYDPGGEIFITKYYNRALTPTEILQNYNATKGRFGLK